MADLVSDPGPKGDTPNDTSGAPRRGSTTSTPRWVKLFGIVVVVLVLVFAVLHLTGHGFSNHASIPRGAQQP